KAGDISDGALMHKDLRVFNTKLDHLIDRDPRVKEKLTANPKWRGGEIQLDVETPGLHGGGIGGRVIEEASWNDMNGLFEFAASPEPAPIVHFAGPWQILFYDKPSAWHIGSVETPYLAVGTPGVGPGATAFVQYQGVIPPELKPALTITYPAPKGQSPIIGS